MSTPAVYDYYVYFNIGKFMLVPASTPPVLTPVTGLNNGNYRDLGTFEAISGAHVVTSMPLEGGSATSATADTSSVSYPDDVTHIHPRAETIAKDFWVFKDADDKLLAQPLVEAVLMFSPYPPNTVKPTVLWGGYSGSGSPEGVVTAVRDSIFTRTDGGQGTKLYVKTTDTGNTGWVAVAM